MAGEEEEGSAPLLLKLPKASKEQEEHVNRSGTIWTAIAHIITAVIGAGVLSLAWSMAQLGWIAGPVAMALFAAVTLIQSTLLADCYRTPDPEHGHLRNHHYMDAVRFFLGERSVWICGFLQQLSLYGTGLAYTITAATSMRYYYTSALDLVCSYFSEQVAVLKLNSTRNQCHFHLRDSLLLLFLWMMSVVLHYNLLTTINDFRRISTKVMGDE